MDDVYLPLVVRVLLGGSGKGGASEAGDEEDGGGGTHFECLESVGYGEKR